MPVATSSSSALGMSGTSAAAPASASGSKGSNGTSPEADEFDIVGAYERALQDDKVPHPIAAILALTQLMQVSTASTLSNLLSELVQARQRLVSLMPSLGARAGCQLFERFVGFSGAGTDFPSHKASLIHQGRTFCAVTAPECRRKIAELAIGFIQDDSVILTHSYSRTVMESLLRAHKQNKRIKVYVAEARPQGLGLKTHQILTAHGIPCTVLLDSALAYVLPRVSLVLIGTEAVVESGGLVSSIGTAQMAALARMNGKPVYAVAESYKFLRYYPLGPDDLPRTQMWVPTAPEAVARGKGKEREGRWIDEPRPLEFDEVDEEEEVPAGEQEGDRRRAELGHSRRGTIAPAEPHRIDTNEGAAIHERSSASRLYGSDVRWDMTQEMEAKQPLFDITTPELIDFVITDLGALSPTSVSQYLVAQFSS